MTKAEFLRELENVVQADPNTLVGNEVLGTLGLWDSLAMVSFMLLADEKLGLTLVVDDIRKAKSVPDLVAMVASKLDG